MKSLKIAVFHNLPASGALRALYDNLNILKKHGHYIDVYTTDIYANDNFLSLEEVSDNVFIYPIKRSNFRKIIFNTLSKVSPSLKISKNSRAYIRFKDMELLQKEMANDIDNNDYDVVLSEQDPLFTVTPVLFKYIKTPLVYYCPQPYRLNDKIVMKLNGDDSSSFYMNLYNKIFEKKYIDLDIEYAQYANNILVNSYFTHENLLRTYGMNSQVSYLGIDTHQFYPQNIEREDIVLSISAISTSKGHDFIIRSIGNVDISVRPKLVIVGYSANKRWLNHLKSLANDLGVELEILENVSYDELVVLYNKAKLVIFAPYLEAFGLVPLESFACGTPVIGVKEGGVKETVKHNVTGLLLDRDENLFAEGITELLTNQELWNKFSENGPRYIDNFWTLNHAGERLLNHIYRILEEENKNRGE